LLKANDVLLAGYVVKTEDDGALLLGFKDGSEIVIGPDTKLAIPRDYCKYESSYNLELIDDGKITIRSSGKTTLNITTRRSVSSNKKTQYTVEIVKDGDKTTDILKVYEGSVEFRQNFQGEGFKKGTKDREEEMKKLNEDLQSGKITKEEFAKKMLEIQNKIKEDTSTDPNYFVTVNAGYMSSITDANKPTDPEPFDTNADRWWEDMK
jgi:hypothetical protein